MNRAMMLEIQQLLKSVEADETVGCIVFTGAGRAFSAGGDIHEQREHDRHYTQEELDRMRTYEPLFEIGTCKKPTIRHDERPRLWRRGGAGVVARYAVRL